MRLLLPLLLSLSLALSGCTLLPQASEPPRKLTLSPLQPSTSVEAPAFGGQLAIERPQTSTPLSGRQAWYLDRDGTLNAFAQHVWSDSLDRLLQQQLTLYLAQSGPFASTATDAPGFRADYRLRLTLNRWYLDTRTQQLNIDLYAQLLNDRGEQLAARVWQANPPVTPLSPVGMQQASQDWLQTWAEALQDWLQTLPASPSES